MPAIPKIILGISACHGDSSAAIIKDGVLVAAAEEERFNRIKHYALYPEKAVAYCLSHAGVAPKDVDTVAIAKLRYNLFWKKVGLAIAHPHLLQKNLIQRRNQYLNHCLSF